jgi:hypothetical protein
VFVTIYHFHPSLIFGGQDGDQAALWAFTLMVCGKPCLTRVGVADSDTLAYYNGESITAVNCFIVKTGAFSVKKFGFVIFAKSNISLQASIFSIVSHFHWLGQTH